MFLYLLFFLSDFRFATRSFYSVCLWPLVPGFVQGVSQWEFQFLKKAQRRLCISCSGLAAKKQKKTETILTIGCSSEFVTCCLSEFDDSLCPVIVPADRPVDLPLTHFTCGSAYLIILKELLVVRLVNPFAQPVIHYQPLAEALF